MKLEAEALLCRWGSDVDGWAGGGGGGGIVGQSALSLVFSFALSRHVSWES